MEIEIGRGKKARQAYGFDDIAIVPSRRTRDPDDIDLSWKLGPYQFELPLMASAMDGVVSPRTAGIVGNLGGLAVLNLEGIFTRYEDAEEQLERIAELPKEQATREMQEIYAEPVKPELITQRIREIKEQKVVVAASLTPQRVLEVPRARAGGRARRARDPGDGRLRGARLDRVRAAEPEGVHPDARGAGRRRRLRLLPHGTAPDAHGRRRRARRRRAGRGVHDARGARDRRAAGDGDRGRGARALDAHAGDGRVLPGDRRRRDAQRRRRLEGDRARRRRGDDRLAARARVRGPGQGLSLGHGDVPSVACPRGARVATTQNGTLEEILVGPARENDGTFNLFGGLRTSMATCGHKDLAEFNRAEVVIAPALQTEGKALQRDQGVGMGSNGAAAAVLVND